MFVVCDWMEKELGYKDFPYENITKYKSLNEALEAVKNHNVLLRYRDNLDYVFFDFKKGVFVEWEYDTGNEEPNILGSGSTFYHTFHTRILEDAMKAYEDSRNYLTRKIRVNGQYHSQYYDSSEKKFVETR